jgi:predicted site-specific integrase-resolvase
MMQPTRRDAIAVASIIGDRLTVKELTEKLGVTNHVVYYWIERGYVKARKINEGSPYWIKMDPAKEFELKTRIYKTKKCTS